MDLREKHEDKKLVSYSQLRMFNKCKRKWQYRYRDKLKPPGDTIHTIGGTSFHDVIQEYLEELYHNEDPDVANNMDLQEKFKHRLRKEYRDTKKQDKWQEVEDVPATKEQLIEYYKYTCNILKEFKNNSHIYFDPEYTELIGIEVPIDEELTDGVVWIGYLDVVLRDRDTGKYIVIDIKTSTSGWTKWDKEDKDKTSQLVAYKDFYANHLGVSPNQIEVKYWIAARKPDWNWTNAHIEEFDPKQDKWEIEQVRTNIEEFVSTAFHPGGDYVQDNFERNPKKFNCCFCSYSKQFNDGDMAVCDQNGMVFDDYPKKMSNYIDEKWCKNS